MGKYIIIHGQSLYDVALHIYGSIEGITDLLINNESLSLTDKLNSGDELIHTDNYVINREIAAYYQTHNITPASGERKVYAKTFTLPKTVEVYMANSQISVGFAVSGSGVIEVDWGDNSPIEQIKLTDSLQNINHVFDSPIGGKRKVLMYMQCSLKSLDISNLHPTDLYILKPLYVERLRVSKMTLSLESIPLLQGLFNLTIDNVRTENLQPLVKLHDLMHLSLTGYVYKQPTIDAYLIALVERYSNRRSCRIEMTTEPSGSYIEPSRDDNNRYVLTSGMEAIWVITHEPAWNEGGAWEFIINDKTYKYE